MTLTCRDIERRLTQSDDDELEALRDDPAVQTHLQTCESCARLLRAVRDVDAALAEPSLAPVPEAHEIIERVQARRKGLLRAARRDDRRASWVGTGVGLLEVATLCVIVALLVNQRQEQAQLDDAAVNLVLAQNDHEVRECSAPDGDSDVTLQWTIDTSGVVRDLEIIDAQGSYGMARCLKERLMHWRFPASNNGPTIVRRTFSPRSNK